MFNNIRLTVHYCHTLLKELNSADIILLLISVDFLSSKDIVEVELPKALERHKKGLAKVVPVYIRDCDFKGLPFEKLEGLPKNAQPIANFEEDEEDTALKEVALAACRRTR